MSYQSVSLGEVAHVSMGSAPPGESYNTNGQGVPMIAGAGDYGAEYPEPKKWTTAPSRVTARGDLIVCVRATIGDLNWADKEYCLGRGVAGLRPKDNKLDLRYAAHYIAERKDDLSKLGTGSTFLAIRRGDLENFPIPLPPLPEQKRIAAILDKADAIRKKRKQAIALTEDLLRSTFLDMFGDPVLNPKGWEVKRLNGLAEITTGNTPSRAIEDYYGEGIEWIKSDNINTPDHFLTRATEALTPKGEKIARAVPAGATLMTCIAGSPDCIGNVALADRKVAFNQQINALTPKKKVNPYFLYSALLCSKGWIQRASTNSMKGMVSKGRLSAVAMIAPPSEIQREFAQWFTSFLEMRGKMSGGAGEAENLCNALSDRAFRGEL